MNLFPSSISHKTVNYHFHTQNTHTMHLNYAFCGIQFDYTFHAPCILNDLLHTKCVAEVHYTCLACSSISRLKNLLV